MTTTLVDRIKSITEPGDLELKAIRMVRTPAGSRRYKQPIGAVIITDRNGKVLQAFSNLASFNSANKGKPDIAEKQRPTKKQSADIIAKLSDRERASLKDFEEPDLASYAALRHNGHSHTSAKKEAFFTDDMADDFDALSKEDQSEYNEFRDDGHTHSEAMAAAKANNAIKITNTGKKPKMPTEAVLRPPTTEAGKRRQAEAVATINKIVSDQEARRGGPKNAPKITGGTSWEKYQNAGKMHGSNDRKRAEAAKQFATGIIDEAEIGDTVSIWQNSIKFEAVKTGEREWMVTRWGAKGNQKQKMSTGKLVDRVADNPLVRQVHFKKGEAKPEPKPEPVPQRSVPVRRRQGGAASAASSRGEAEKRIAAARARVKVDEDDVGDLGQPEGSGRSVAQERAARDRTIRSSDMPTRQAERVAVMKQAPTGTMITMQFASGAQNRVYVKQPNGLWMSPGYTDTSTSSLAKSLGSYKPSAVKINIQEPVSREVAQPSASGARERMASATHRVKTEWGPGTVVGGERGVSIKLDEGSTINIQYGTPGYERFRKANPSWQPPNRPGGTGTPNGAANAPQAPNSAADGAEIEALKIEIRQKTSDAADSLRRLASGRSSKASVEMTRKRYAKEIDDLKKRLADLQKGN